MQDGPFMPKATAVWLVQNTTLSFKQIANFCKLHELEVKGIADGDVAKGIKAYNPILAGQLTRDEIDVCSKDDKRDLKINKREFFGGSMTISSLGGIGGTFFTPIINPPQVAILGVSRATKKLYLNDSKIVEKSILPVCLSYDHRVINGGDAGRFMVHLKELIEKHSL